MPASPIIDSHLHIWDREAVSIPWLASDALLDRSFSLADFNLACGRTVVEAMVFVECDVAAADALREVAWVSQQAKQDQRIRAIVAHAPLDQGVLALPHLEQLSRFNLIRGIRRLIQAELDPEFCTRPPLVEGVRLLSRFNWSFDACIVSPQLENLTRLVDMCPTVSFVLDHLGKPRVREKQLNPWRAQMFELARRDNVVCKLSGVATEASHTTWTYDDLIPFMDTALDAFGPKRIMFGGDWPVATHAVTYENWVATVDRHLSELSEDERDAIYRRTASSFYRLN
ncbi:amidohydrolase family protein [Bradyrhizobium manausense]